MRIRVSDPISAATTTGGCTLEIGIGWWTYAEEPIQGLGEIFEDVRDALYIPTLQKSGEPVEENKINYFLQKAKELGFIELSPASGMWVLSETGQAQTEHIWICHARSVSEKVKAGLKDLAEEIKTATNQDCVAWEDAGKLHFTN